MFFFLGKYIKNTTGASSHDPEQHYNEKPIPDPQ